MSVCTKSRLIGLKGLVDHCLGIGVVRQLGEAVAPQHPIGRRAAHLRGNELTRHCQQIVQGQPQHSVQIKHQRLLPVVQCLREQVQRVTAISRRAPPAPLHDGVRRLTEARHQLVNDAFRLSNRLAHRRRGGRILVQAQQHPGPFFHRAKTPTRTSRPIRNGRLL